MSSTPKLPPEETKTCSAQELAVSNSQMEETEETEETEEAEEAEETEEEEAAALFSDALF